MEEEELVSTQTVAVGLQPEIAPDVFAFAREQGVDHYLQPLIELTQQIYPTATKFKIFVEEDGEIRESFIVFELDAALNVEQAVAADRRWGEGFFRISVYPHSCVFRLSVNLP